MPTLLPSGGLCPIVVGRAAQIEFLAGALEATRRGAGQIVLIGGAPGIGKSRLVAHTSTQEHARDFLILRARCFDQDRALPFASLADLLDTSLAQPRARAALEPTIPELLPLFPELTASFPDTHTLPPLDPALEKRRAFRALGEGLKRLAAQQPLLVVWEDAHWCDENSAEFLVSLARQMIARAVSLWITYRPDELSVPVQSLFATLIRERRAVELALERLGESETEEMIRAIFGQKEPLRADLRASIYGLTEGNPFFVEEALKALVSAGDIFYTRGGWSRKPLAQLRIPRSLQDAVQARVAGLAESARQLVVVAAVAGRRFDFDILRRVTGASENQVFESLKELIAAQLVVEESADEFAFRHALTQQAIYQGLLTRERRALHRRVGDALEQRNANARDMPLENLAQQFFAGEMWEKAAVYARRAGERAEARYAPRAAIEHYTHALTANEAQGLEQSHELAFARARNFERIGAFENARGDYERALAAARAAHAHEAEWRAQLAIGFLWAERDFGKTRAHLDHALELARGLEDAKKLAQTYNRIGNWYANADQPKEALHYHHEAFALFQKLNDPIGLAETHDLSGTANYLRGDIGQGTAHFRQAAAIFRERGERQSLSSVLSMSAFAGITYFSDSAFWIQVDPAEGTRLYHEANELARSIEWRSGEGDALSSLGMSLGPLGEYANAFEYVEQGLSIMRAIEHRMGVTFSETTLGALYLDVLDTARAQQHLERAREGAHELNARYLALLVNTFLAQTYLAQGELERAQALLDEMLADIPAIATQPQRHAYTARAEVLLARDEYENALRVVEQIISSMPRNAKAIPIAPRLWRMRGEALLGLKRFDAAQETLDAARGAAETLGVRPQLWRIFIALGKLYAVQNSRERAEEAFARARALIEILAAPLADSALRENFVQRAHALIPHSTPRTTRQQAKYAAGGLTMREREIAARIAKGKTNREIAQELVVSERTVGAHVQNILGKLGFHTRAQIAVWAAERGMRDEEVKRVVSSQ